MLIILKKFINFRKQENKMVKIIKYLIFALISVLMSLQLFSQGKSDVIAQYSCRNSDVTTTIVRDVNSDGVYDTYTVMWCNGSSNTYPILAIGDIRKWPPTGIPTREIIESSQTARTMTEAYFSMSSSIILCWFVRPLNCDTVYYFDNRPDLSLTNTDEYYSDNIGFKVTPNPANEFLDINYNLTENSWVTITLYNEVGINTAEIENKMINKGNYNIHYSLKDLSSGTYFLSVKLGLNEIFTKQISIIK
ncbi:T9SS C-terminal target domain-containing protein [Bacteroidetes/Chlorobi group bacterium ChocPot_Mid]|jgi:hypothetical protein|nr:MAG: T9SS C-terminal target domain-containing protein [Bacteroidetes/Chlorobi group bacterium ChocPot_Mid]